MGVELSLMYHVSVMPCFDKKLEASRSDFYSDIYRTRYVDCVITTGELERMFDDYKVDIGTCASFQQSSDMYFFLILD